MSIKDLDPATQLVHAGRDWNPDWGYVNPPVVRASTVLHASCEDMMARVRDEQAVRDGKPCYGTYGGPAHKAFYSAMKTLEGPNAAGAWAFSTGLAATTTPLFAFVKAGSHALFSDSIYGPTREFAEEILGAMGVDVEFFDPCASPEAIEALMRPETTLLMMENPGSHSFEMSDVPGIAAVCRRHGVTSVIDNTWATPLYFKPLDHGVDMVVHAATKFIAGHSDLTMGVVVCNARVWPAVYRTAVRLGQAASADDVYLAYRGLHTMGVRVEHAARSAEKIVHWLLDRPEVETVRWPALASDPSHAIWKRDYTGATSLFAVVFKPEYAGKLSPFVDALKLFGRGYSWGGYESLLIPGYGTRTVRGADFSRMVRIAVGLESADDLIADLAQGLEHLRS